MAHQEYPKRLYIDGKPVRVLNEDEEAALVAPEPSPARRGRPPKAAAEPVSEPDADPAE